MQKTLVLGAGNTIRGDDGIGIFAARALREQIGSFLDIKETQEAGLNLLDMIAGYDRVIVIDSVRTRRGKPGSIHRLTKDTFGTTSVIYSSHQMGLATIIKMADNLNMDIPSEIIIYAVEIEKGDSFGEILTPEVRKAIPKAVDLIKKELHVSTNKA